MNLYGSPQSRSDREVPEVNMTAVMNIFLILIPFLLLTAAFVKIAVLEVSLPTGNSSGVGAPPAGRSVLVIIGVDNAGRLQIKTTTKEVQFDPIMPLSNGKCDYESLKFQLKRLKSNFGWLNELILQPGDNVAYDVIIKIMDRCREEGFPNVSLA